MFNLESLGKTLTLVMKAWLLDRVTRDGSRLLAYIMIDCCVFAFACWF